VHTCVFGLQGPCVLFATPGMLHGGTSLEVFKAWAPDPSNLVLLPSYQVRHVDSRWMVCPASVPSFESQALMNLNLLV
jgi:integrator complex subunit 11